MEPETTRPFAWNPAGMRREAAWIAAALATFLLAWLLVTSGPFLVVAALGAAATILAILRFPWIGVLLLLLSVPAQEFGAVTLGGQSLTLTRAMFPLAITGYIVSMIVRREPLRGTRVLVPYALLVLIISVSTAWASSMDAAGAEAGRWIIALVSFVILIHFTATATRRRLMIFVVAMAFAGVFQATYGVTQSLLAIGPESFRVGSEGSRAFGTFGQPNSYAGYLEMVFFPVFWMAVYVISKLPARLTSYRTARFAGFHASRSARLELLGHLVLAAILVGPSVLILGGVVASYSRGAWLGIAAGGILSALLYHRWVRRGLLLITPLVVLLALGGAPAVLPESISDRVTNGIDDLRLFDASNVTITEENFAAAERMAHWQAGWRMFSDHPVTGVGGGNFNERYDDYFVREQFRFTRGHAHNFYIHTLAETGVAGLVTYLWLIGSMLALTLQVIFRTPAGFERMLAIGAFGTIVSVGVHNVFENLHVLNLSIQLGAVWALAIAAHRRSAYRDHLNPE